VRLARTWRAHRDVLTGGVAQALQFGAALLLLPLVATRLSAPQIGIWFVFTTIQGMSTLVDFGFQPNITRAFAAAYAGSPELLRQGVAPAAAAGPNLALVARILTAARRLYLGLAAAVLALLAGIGTPYVAGLARSAGEPAGAVVVPWLVFAAGVAANLALLWGPSLLMGAGRVHQSYVVTILMRGGFSLLGVAALLAGWGLAGLAAASLAAVLLGAAYLWWALRPLVRQADALGPPPDTGSLLGTLWYNSSRTGLVLVGGFLINRANVLVFSTMIGVAASGRYAVTLQLLSAAMALAQLPTLVAVPRMTALRVRDEGAALRRLFLARHAALLAIFVALALGIGVAGQPLLRLIGSNIDLLAPAEYWLLALVLLLEINSINAGYLLSTGNRVPFVRSALLSGAGVIAGSVGAIWLGWGVLGAIAAQGLVQAAYNNWKWPLEAWREMRQWT
jgi:O-antigen/teichoic acid export membrane protein